MKKIFIDKLSLEASVSISNSVHAEVQNMDGTNKMQVNQIRKISCNICGKELKNRSSKSRHLKTMHGVNAKGNVVIQPVRDKISCLHCGKLYSTVYSLQRHIDTVHLYNELETKLYSCSHCPYKSVHKHNLVKHIATHKNGTNVCSQFKCFKCEAQFQSKTSLNVHKKKVHVTNKRNLSICRKCPLCSFTSSMYLKKEIHNHFEKVHNLNMKWEKHEFNSLDEFHNWKEVIEKTTETSYVTAHIFSSDSVVYKCNRSGTYKPKSIGLRNTKYKGSCKINSFCPSEIKVKGNEETIKVKYLAEHVGHKNQLQYTRLSAKDRKYVSLQLINKVPKREILRRAQRVSDKQKLQRLHLINMTDIENIKASLNLEEEWQKTTTGKVTTKLRTLNKAHQKSLSISLSHVIPSNDYEWEVLSRKKTELYKVKKVKNCKKCQLQCSHCLSCFHEFSCSCIENSIKSNMCEHIHAVCRKMYPSDNAVQTCSRPEHDELNTATIFNEITHSHSSVFENRKSKVFEKLQGVLNILETKVNLTKQLDVMELKMKELQSVVEAIASTENQKLKADSSPETS